MPLNLNTLPNVSFQFLQPPLSVITAECLSIDLGNREVIVLKDLGPNDESVEISSPFFPSLYPLDHSVEHIVTCDACRILLVFSDFQLQRSSSMEFYDTSGERLFLTGSTFRPPILVTSGNT